MAAREHGNSVYRVAMKEEYFTVHFRKNKTGSNFLLIKCEESLYFLR
jgi:hypothetical protein